jgi:Domain of unknown function (DUF4262)
VPGRAGRMAWMSHPPVKIEPMCVECDGASADDVRFDVHGLIARFGWAIVPVEDEVVASSWAYTIGLCQGFDHPELAVVGLRSGDAGRLLNAVAGSVRNGVRFHPGETIHTPDGAWKVAPVATRHFTLPTFAMWVDYYGALGEPRPEPAALEIHRAGGRPALDWIERLHALPRFSGSRRGARRRSGRRR